jgi:hypothetical protein
VLLLLWSVCHAAVARAAPASETTQACVAASTQGQTARDEGRLLAAREQLLSCAREVCPSIVKKSCADWLNELAGRIPSVVVRVQEGGQRDVTDARVTLDGRSIALDGRPLPLDPGTHRLSVDMREGPPVERTFLLAEREQGRLLLIELPVPSSAVPAEPTPSEAAPPAPRPEEPAPVPAAQPGPEPSSPGFTVPTGAWVLGGLGVVGVVSFTVLRIKLASDLRELERTCSPNCTDRQRDDGKRQALIADLSLGIGVAALAGASAWTVGSWLAHRDDARQEPQGMTFSLAPTRGGAVAALAARF